MKFGAVPVAEAEGAILAHSLEVAEGKLSKGTVLSAAHLQDITASGRDLVTVARLEPGDVEENTAAARLARAVADAPEAQGLRIAEAGAGRVNLYATGPGVIEIDTGAVLAMNSIDPMITIATVPAWQRTETGRMVATIKIISYAVAEAHLERAMAAGRGALRRCAPGFAQASLIETSVTGRMPSAKGRAALEARLERLEVGLSAREVTGHAAHEIAEALRRAPGEVLFVLGASATSDLRDEAPEAVRRAGGEVISYGMPVDPGNLLFLGRLGDKPVVGLPGCARSPAMNGADWVLERVICGVDLTQADISAMGVGGLLKEIPSRPRPRREAK